MKRTGLLIVAGCAAALAGVCRLPRHVPEPPSARMEAPERISPWAPVFDASLPAAERLALARKLDSSFPLLSVETWIRNSQQAGAGAVPPDDCLVYNEILDQSRQRGLFPAALGAFLIARMNDSRLDPVLRDYALQQLSLWLSAGGSGQPSETDPARRRTQLAALRAVARDETLHSTTMPGTALLALADIAAKSASDPSSLQPELDEAIAGILADHSRPAGLRISAIQAAAMADRAAHLPALRGLLMSAAPDSAEFLSVISALGGLGDASDRALLLSLEGINPPAARAVASALHRLPR